MAQDSDFLVEISGGPDRYQVKVSSPAGEDATVISLEADEFLDKLPLMQAAVLGSAARARSGQPGLEGNVREIGEKLFDAVFTSAVPGLFLSSRQSAEEHGDSLRVVFQVRAPELAALPWELLYNAKLGGYLSLHHPLVRRVDVLEPKPPLRISPPLHVLGMISLPGALQELEADDEKGKLESALKPLTDEGLVRLEWVAGQTKQDLQMALLRGCHVLHFVGHGRFDRQRHKGMIVFADERGREDPLHAEALEALISLARPRPRLVVLNSCETGTTDSQDIFSSAAAELEHVVPAVVAMQFPVTDRAAVLFAGAFYQALAANRSVDEAVRAGRVALRVDKDDSLECFTPVLYQRSGDAHLFELQHQADALQKSRVLPQDGETQRMRDRAITAFWQAHDDAGWEEAYERLRLVAQELPQDAELKPMLTRAHVQVSFQRGVRAEETENYRAAAEFYRTALANDPHHAQARSRLAGISASERAPRDTEPGTWRRPGHRPQKSARPSPAPLPRMAIGQWVLALSVHPDGRRLVTGSRKWVRLWDVRTGQRIWERPVHGWSCAVGAVAFSPEGARLATGSADNRARLWDTVTAEQQFTLQHKHFVNAVAFSPEGERLVTGDAEGLAQVWDLASRQPVVQVRHGRAVQAVTFAPNGDYFATASEDGTALVWDSRSGDQCLRLTHENSVLGIAYAPDGSSIATCGEDHSVRLWDSESGEEHLKVQHDRAVHSVAFAPDGALFASGGDDRTARVWDAGTGRQLLCVAHDSGVNTVAFFPDGRYLASGGGDKTVRSTTIPETP